ncbi:MAG: hypothetical protein ABJX32_06920 [Tateyamaria sp.]|uniref:hypothetical protein n=1 Tax=Tateyamaria sp. TaxID=1929288 RepID=UPI0032A00910
MLVQRTSPPGFHQIVEQFAALQRDFPKAVTQCGQIAQNPNRSFAAPQSDVSVADKAATGSRKVNVRFFDALDLRLTQAGLAYLQQGHFLSRRSGDLGRKLEIHVNQSNFSHSSAPCIVCGQTHAFR